MAASPRTVSSKTSPAQAGPAKAAARRRLTAHDLASRVRESIQNGELEAGVWLREARLCEEFDTGRSTVREALRLLAEDGLVKFERNRGACVASITLFEMFDLFELRAALYGLAARFTCFRASDKALAAIREKIAELIEAAERAKPPETLINLGGDIFALLTQHASPDAQRTIAAMRRKSRWHYSYIGLAESPGALGPLDQWRALSVALGARDAMRAAEAARNVIYFMQQEVMRAMVSRGLGASPDHIGGALANAGKDLGV